VPYNKVYSDEQRQAVIYAWCDAKLRPAYKISRQALNAELRLDGRTIPSFTIPEASAREIGKKEERRRRGLAGSKLAEQAPREAVESSRKRLAAILDHELTRLEDEQRRKTSKPIDGLRITKLARATRELAAMPGPDDARPAPPPLTRGRDTDSTLAGQLRRAARGGPIQPDTTARTPPTPPENTEEDTQRPNKEGADTSEHSNGTQPNTNTDHETNGERPDSAAFERRGALQAERVTVRPA